MCFLSNGYTQNTASVAITLENTKSINIERNNFFEQAHNYSLVRLPDDELSIQFNKGYELPKLLNLNVSKIDDYHYLLRCRSDKPEMVYINYKPIYITPGDSVQLTYKMTGQEMNTIQDSIIAYGKNNCDYTFSNYTFNRALLKYRPDIKSAVYKLNSELYFKDLARFYQLNDTFFNSLFTKKGCAKPLVEYLGRKRRVDLLFDLFYYEEQLQYNNNTQLNRFSDLIDTAFAKSNFKPADTSYSFVMENVFKGYFKYLVNVKFNRLKSKNDYDNLYSYVKNYPKPFVRDYFLYFLAMNYDKNPLNINAAEVDKLLEESNNLNIKNAIKQRI